MEEIVRLVALALAACLLLVFIKQTSPDMGLLLSLGVILIIGVFTFSLLHTVVDFVRQLAEATGIDNGLVTPLVKVTALTLLSRLAADICRDAKETALASGLEMAAAAACLYLVLPLFSAVMQLIRSLL